RKAAQITREAHKLEKKEKLKNEKALHLNLICEKLQRFQNYLDPQNVEHSKRDACELTESYLNQFSSELERIELHSSTKVRQGRQHFSRGGHQADHGAKAAAVEWDFDLKKLPNITMRKICANDAVPKKCKKKTVTAADRFRRIGPES
ncbi:hypothetical protein EI555_018644, partial [Monodon monoceros]